MGDFYDYWSVVRMWPGATVYILGGGPSLKDMDLTPIYDKRVIGVNNAYLLGDWVDVVWWGDCGWYEMHKNTLADFAGLNVHCCNRDLKRPGTKRLVRGRPVGIDRRPTHVSWNHNSGASAINLAYHLGAKRIVLLGFDMKFGENRENNWHDQHPKKEKRWNPYPAFLKNFPIIKQEADRLGLEILNATPGSALTIFPMVQLEETL